MQPHEIGQVLLFLLLLTALALPLGKYIANVIEGKLPAWLKPLRRLERFIYSLSGVRYTLSEAGDITTEEMNWKHYTIALLLFNLLGFVVLLLLQLLQSALPLNPQHLPNVPFWLSFNTAVSFMTNTNWQAYSGETTLSYATQMLGLTVQNFVSAATGIAVLLALTRAIARKSALTLGNFWQDMTRTTVYLLLPFSIVLAIALVSQGVVQSFASYHRVQGLTGAEQTIPLGPAASQIAIKQLGTNGGGFFGVNSAHPFENPTPFSNFLQLLSILLIPAALTLTYGKMVGSLRQGWTLFAAMMLLFIVGLGISLWSEYQYNPVLQTAMNMEGKETRFGLTNSVLWSTATTAASNGSVNAMHDSLSPVAGGMALLNIMLGEIIFGGVGAGLYGMLIFVFLTVFIAGLMVGRSPEYMGKKIESFDIKMAMIAVLAPSTLILVFSAIACGSQSGLAGLNNKGAHGLTEILYAFSSAAGNNGSAFAGLGVNTDFYNILTGFAMLIGRFGVILPIMAIAGNMVKKRSVPPSLGTFPTDTALFVLLLLGVILIVGALTFFPALSLAPIVEHLLMLGGVPQ